MLSPYRCLNDKILGFFNTLNKDLVTKCQQLSPEILQDLMEGFPIQSQRLHFLYKQKLIDPSVEDLVNHLIYVAHNFLTPMFLELVKVFSNHKRTFITLDSALEDGWEFLEKYFLTWIHGLEVPQGFHSSTRDMNDWFNNHEVITQLLSLRRGRQAPLGLAKCLFSQWANDC